MADSTQQTWKQRYGPLLARLLGLLLAALVGGVGNDRLRDRRVERVRERVEVPAPVPPRGEQTEYTPTFGWQRDDAAVAESADPLRTVQFAATPAGRAALAADADVFLWRLVRRAANRNADWYPNVNQEGVGCCVGCATKHSVDVAQAAAIAGGAAAEWKPVSVEVIYAGSRNEVGGGRISGDGSVGAWAAKWCKDYGVVPMEKFPAADLTTFSPARARQWGRTGVPDELEPLAKRHPVKGVAAVRSWEDVDRAVRQSYPVLVCSDRGFGMERDRDGFCPAQGTWYHAMAVVGVRGGERPGAFILNSWGDRAHTGPTWPADMPVAGFWADAKVVDRMVRQGDSFALSDVVGFPARKLDNWFIAAPRRDGFALDLRPEVRLAW